MTDKELIKEEIERRIENLKISLDKNCVTEESKLDIRGNITTLYSLLNFIDSLQEESTDEANCTQNDDLKKEISKWRNHYISVLDNNLRIDLRDIEVVANHFANWQEQQMKETLQTEYEKGRFDMREEMMKNAIKTTIVNDLQYGKDPDHAIIPAIHQRIEGFDVGDRVNIIIVKEDLPTHYKKIITDCMNE